MFKKINLMIIIGFSLQLSMYSCKKQEKINTETKKEHIQKTINYTLDFPDTLYVNQTYSGVLKYKSVLDSITTSFDDKKKKRYVLFYLTTVNKPDSDHKHLKKIAKVFGAKNNREIPFYNIKFIQLGDQYIDGIINDYVVIDINKKDKDGFELLREIENEERIIHKVVVINRPSSKPTKR